MLYSQLDDKSRDTAVSFLTAKRRKETVFENHKSIDQLQSNVSLDLCYCIVKWFIMSLLTHKVKLEHCLCQNILRERKIN